MLDPERIKQIAKSYSPQEVFAALVWQRQFNNFDGERVITDLSNNSDLWHSFIFTRPIYDKDSEGLSFSCMVSTLLAMATYRPVPETSMIRPIAYPADTLYVLTENQEISVSKLIDLGKNWQADSVEIVDSSNSEYSYITQSKLKASIGRKDQLPFKLSNLERLDAVIVTFWWD